MLTYKDRQIKEHLDRIFGDSPATAELKEFVFLVQTGRMTEDQLQDYHKRKQEEMDEILERMQPMQSETTESVCIPGVIYSNSILEDTDQAKNGKTDDNAAPINTDTILINAGAELYAVERRQEEPDNV